MTTSLRATNTGERTTNQHKRTPTERPDLPRPPCASNRWQRRGLTVDHVRVSNRLRLNPNPSRSPKTTPPVNHFLRVLNRVQSDAAVSSANEDSGVIIHEVLRTQNRNLVWLGRVSEKRWWP